MLRTIAAVLVLLPAIASAADDGLLPDAEMARLLSELEGAWTINAAQPSASRGVAAAHAADV